MTELGRILGPSPAPEQRSFLACEAVPPPTLKIITELGNQCPHDGPLKLVSMDFNIHCRLCSSGVGIITLVTSVIFLPRLIMENITTDTSHAPSTASATTRGQRLYPFSDLFVTSLLL